MQSPFGSSRRGALPVPLQKRSWLLGPKSAVRSQRRAETGDTGRLPRMPIKIKIKMSSSQPGSTHEHWWRACQNGQRRVHERSRTLRRNTDPDGMTLLDRTLHSLPAPGAPPGYAGVGPFPHEGGRSGWPFLKRRSDCPTSVGSRNESASRQRRVSRSRQRSMSVSTSSAPGCDPPVSATTGSALAP